MKERQRGLPRPTGVLSAWLLAASSLIVPYFEISTEAGNAGYDTRFTVNNHADKPQLVRMTIWTDGDRAILWFNLRLEARSSQAISMRRFLVGNPWQLPYCGGAPDVIGSFASEAVCTLTSGCPFAYGMARNDCSKPWGRRHAHAIGYVTLEAIEDCDDLQEHFPLQTSAALSGSYEQIVQDKTVFGGALVDRAAMNWKFRGHRLPRDPKAKEPPKECQPIVCILPPPP